MPFSYFVPSAALRPYIQCFWILEGGGSIPDVLYPDGCIDIIANLGKQLLVREKEVLLEPDCVYLGGAITEAIYQYIPMGVRLLGVRFQPGCYEYFYKPQMLADIKDGCIRVANNMLPSIECLKENPLLSLNIFFASRINFLDNGIKDAIDMIVKKKGNTNLSAIAGHCHKSPRQTERIFKRTVGLTPKQFCNIIQFSNLQKLLYTKTSNETLLGVALDAGYYDHAHLTKAYKKITRHRPSQK